MINTTLIQELESITHPQTLIKTIFDKFRARAAIGTSGQLTGTVMVDMAVQAEANPRVFTIDTLRLFNETYDLFDAIEKKYDIKVEKIRPDPIKIGAMIKEHGEHLFFDSKEKQELCCHLRKVEPNDRVLDTLDVWITGLRADQSKNRAQTTSRFEIISHKNRPILKVAPLLNWTEKHLRDYAKEHEVPTHKLLDWNQDGWYYESLGCVICTTPISPTEPRRAGRWRWFKDDPDKECGLHVPRDKKDEIL